MPRCGCATLCFVERYVPESQTGTASAELKAIVEALIFASPEPITSKTLFKLLADEPKEDIAAVRALKAGDEQRPGLQFVDVAGATRS